jgi:iron complex transport system ATP-binding protein
VIATRNLEVRRGERGVVRDVDLEVASGEVVALAGPNGAGKSTLLAAIAGDVPAHAGAVLLDGSPLGARDLAAMACLRAVVRQGTAVAAELSVLDVVLLGRGPHGDADRPAGREAALRAVRAFGLEDLVARPVPRLSGGEAQRVHLARALAQIGSEALAGRSERGVLLLDEPVAALDLARRLQALDRLRAVASAGIAVLVVLHDLDLAARVADRVVVLDRGRVAADGAPAAVLTPDLLARVFGVRATVRDAPWAPGRPWIGVEGLADPADGAGRPPAR